MHVPDIIIAVDGYSSTGKSTLAKLIAKEFEFLYLDSGAMYRGVTLFAQEKGLIDENSVISPDLEKALEGLDLYFGLDGTYIGDRCIEKLIRTMGVSSQVSPISAVPYVRNFVDDRLHEMAKAGRVVMDGRDIGTTVFPNAELKIFMTASDQVRAQRRFDELRSKGDTTTTFEEVLANVTERDRIDSTRKESPLRQADDAVVLDNSHMTFEQQDEWLYNLYLERSR